MERSEKRPEPIPVTEAAAAWFLRLQDPTCARVDREGFEKWLSASDSHRREYEQYARLWRNLDGINGIPLAKPRARKRAATLAAIAVFGLALAGGVYYRSLGSEQTFVTQVGERKHFRLSDGTAVDLNTNTAMKTTLSWWSRRVDMVRGEALFMVAHESRRTFRVVAAGTILRDMGTRFNVRIDGSVTTVDVLDGAVAVAPPGGKESGARVMAGERIVSSKEGLTRTVLIDPSASTAWLSDRWIFQDAPLNRVVRELNRYHPRQTYLVDSELGRLKVTGVFGTADRMGLLHALQVLLKIRIVEQDDRTLLIPPPALETGG
ncbi:MAG TPA: FecR family protein [Nitrospiria bacterium]|nr:FecR family protein [Nitrospiria bacterium]